MKKYLFFILLFIISFSVMGQSVSLDTLAIEKMTSNIPIIGKVEYLFFVFNESKPFYCTFNRNVRINSFNDKKVVNYLVNIITPFDGSFQYYEKNGKIRLNYFDFKAHTDIYIKIGDLILSRRLTLDELMKKYHYTDTDIAGPQLGIMAPYKTQKTDKFYEVDFSTGESQDVRIELYFDKKKLLRRMYITIFDL